ncbi:DNA-binding protein Alba [archaeon]|jgi:archaea-specific DNA-binding protein|nr:DNA-binding protein Alba [archaeon]
MAEETKITEKESTEEETTSAETLCPEQEDDQVIFIGGKPFMSYVTGVVMQFTTQAADEVAIKARGKFISRAVDIAEVATKRFLEGIIFIEDIKINSEEFENKEGKMVRVSTIEIILKKK